MMDSHTLTRSRGFRGKRFQKRSLTIHHLSSHPAVHSITNSPKLPQRATFTRLSYTATPGFPRCQRIQILSSSPERVSSSTAAYVWCNRRASLDTRQCRGFTRFQVNQDNGPFPARSRFCVAQYSKIKNPERRGLSRKGHFSP